MINAIVFDMDGVLCRYRIERRLALLASWSGQSPDAIHAAIWLAGFEDEAERGAFRRLAAHLGLAPDEILYFDDDAAYVAGAREAGLSAHPVGEAADVRTGLAVHQLDRWSRGG